MTPEEAANWVLLAVGLPSVIAGAYLTGTSGEVHLLLITGVGATGTWVALHEELNGESGEDGASDSEDDASGAGDSGPGAGDGTSGSGDRT